MNAASKYWKLTKINANGHSRTEEILQVKAFFQQQFPQFVNQVDLMNAPIQKHLWQICQDSTLGDRTSAELCLRCYISSQIEQVCIQLETQFGQNYGFSRSDLLPYVLDDDGKVPFETSRSLAKQILQSFSPDRGSLTTWTIRLVKQRRSLNTFLLECGVYLLSDWAMLNDTPSKRLQKVLEEFHQLTEGEIQQKRGLLESYRSVYLRDRLQQRQAGASGQCPPPTDQQLQEISHLVQQKTRKQLPATMILMQLQDLADLLRQHRISVRTGKLITESIDTSENPNLIARLAIDESDRHDEDPQIQFLESYQQGFMTCLRDALESVIAEKVQKQRPQKAQSFVIALQLFHCQGLAMGEIAKQVGLKAQFQVSRLLNLKEFRNDVRHQLLKSLRDWVLSKAEEYVHPDRLKQLDNQIETALSEQIETVMQAAETEAKTPKSYLSGSVFAKSVCEYLDEKQFKLES